MSTVNAAWRCGTLTIREKSSQNPPGSVAVPDPAALHSPSPGPVVAAVRSGPVQVTDVPSGGPILPELGVAAVVLPTTVAETTTAAKTQPKSRVPTLIPPSLSRRRDVNSHRRSSPLGRRSKRATRHLTSASSLVGTLAIDLVDCLGCNIRRAPGQVRLKPVSPY